jgi:beta-phosphoglucomutase
VISAIVFDFDGVLADSEPLHLTAYQEVLTSLGTTLPREEYYARYLGYDDEGVFRALSDARGWGLTEGQITALIAEKTAALESLVAGTDMLYPGVTECVERLAAHWPLGIASGALRHEIEAILRQAGIERHFKFIVASGDTPASKPAPDPYQRAATLHGLPPSVCVAVEDSRWGIESAKAAGLWCIGIASTYPVQELLDADTIVTSLGELTPELIWALGSGKMA